MNHTYADLTFNDIIDSAPKRNYNVSEYHHILSPDYPDFLDAYIKLPLLQRLSEIGLLCGSDWTKLFHNRMFYSRLDHSIGVALIVWHFTHNKAQTIAGLLHDVSTPVFSHVSDFRKGDALTQTATEGPTATMIRADKQLQTLLAADGLTSADVEDYHKYPVADNEIPQLSADRLEYMFPSGMALEGSWTLPDIERCYTDLEILTNEQGLPELGFKTITIAEEYCRRFCMTGHILQMNEDKLVLHMLGQIMNSAVEAGILTEDDFMTKTEKQIIQILDDKLCGKTGITSGMNAKNMEKDSQLKNLARMYKTFRTMEKIERSEYALPADEYFCVNLKVKQRYINPLVKTGTTGTDFCATSDSAGKVFGVSRLYDVSPVAQKIIDDFLSYQDAPYGCVKLV